MTTTTPAGRGPRAEFIPVTEVKVGQVTGEGEVTAVRKSTTGKTVYFTCKSVTGVKEWGHSAGTKVAVFTQPCDYQPVEGDPAVRVCVTHDPEFGLYGDEECSGRRDMDDAWTPGTFFAPAEVRRQDHLDHPHDEPCPKCGRRQWTDEHAQDTCQACGYVLKESDLA